MSVIEEVKQRIDIVDIVGQYTSLTKSGRTLRGLCPFHREKTPSFFVYPEQQSWHCFGACSTGGDVLSFVMKKEGIDFPEALHLLADRAGISISSRPEPSVRKDQRERLYRINDTACLYFYNLLLNSPAAGKAREYVSGRGLSPETVERFRLGFSLNTWDALKEYMLAQSYSEKELVEGGLLTEKEGGGSYDRFRNRLMFPISDRRGNVIGFGARALDDSLPKYLNSPQMAVFDKSSSIYAIELAAPGIRELDQAVVVEGFMDAITAHQSGYTNVVASMGTALTEMQITILKRLSKNVVLALDADAAGEEAMLRSVGYENVLGSEIRVVVLPEGKDPDGVIREAPNLWEDLLGKAMPIMDYTFNMVTAAIELSTASGKSLAVKRLLPVIAGLKDYAYVDHYLEKLGALTGINKAKLEGALSEIKTGASRSRDQQTDVKYGGGVSRTLYSDPREEYCLALLIKHPGLKERDEAPLPEYFESTENREIFNALRKSGDIISLKEELNSNIREHLDSIITRMEMGPINHRIEQKYADCVLQLKIKYLRNLEVKRAEALAMEEKQGGNSAVLAMLQELGTENTVQLRESFARLGREAGSKGGIK